MNFKKQILIPGVLLINNSYWRAYSISRQLFNVADQYHEVEFGDQGILNRFFVGQWKELDFKYNFMKKQINMSL